MGKDRSCDSVSWPQLQLMTTLEYVVHNQLSGDIRGLWSVADTFTIDVNDSKYYW